MSNRRTNNVVVRASTERVCLPCPSNFGRPSVLKNHECAVHEPNRKLYRWEGLLVSYSSNAWMEESRVEMETRGVSAVKNPL